MNHSYRSGLSPDASKLLARAYTHYYKRLFAWLDTHLVGRYALVDLRAGSYDGLTHLSLNLSGPFGMYNHAHSRSTKVKGGSYQGKPTCCTPHDPWRDPCPETLMNSSNKWAYCAAQGMYVPNRNLAELERRCPLMRSSVSGRGP